MKPKTLLTILLCAALLLSSCGSSETTTDTTVDTTAAETAPETSVYDTLPEGKYGGYTFTALQFVFPHLDNMTKYHLTAAEMTGEPVSDALYNATISVEEKLDVALVTDVRPDAAEVHDLIGAQVLAGDTTYDAYLASGVAATEKGYSLKLSDIAAFDFSKPWWNESAMDSLSVTGDTYRAYGNLSLQGYSNYQVMVFNKTVLDNYVGEDLYQVVRDGKWTQDKLAEVSAKAAVDLDGDGKMNPKLDQYGLTMGSVNCHACLIGGDTSLIGFDDDHNAFYKGPDEHYIDVFTGIADITSDKSMYYEAWSTSGLSNYHMLAEDRALLSGMQLIELEQLREMESDYGVIPNPKFDEAQADYISCIYNDYTPVEVPTTSADPERAGVILENLCAQTYRQVKDVYLEDMLSQKLVRDEASIEMLNLIFDCETRMDLLILYQWEGIFGTLNKVFTSGGDKLVSTLAGMEDSLKTAVQASVDGLHGKN